MSLKDLLPPGTFEEIVSEADAIDRSTHNHENKILGNQEQQENTTEQSSDVLMVSCPYCHKKVAYSSSNPFRPFCSEKCKLLDLGAWASEQRTVAGNQINMDEDADLLNDPNLPVRNLPPNS